MHGLERIRKLRQVFSKLLSDKAPQASSEPPLYSSDDIKVGLVRLYTQFPSEPFLQSGLREIYQNLSLEQSMTRGDVQNIAQHCLDELIKKDLILNDDKSKMPSPARVSLITDTLCNAREFVVEDERDHYVSIFNRFNAGHLKLVSTSTPEND